MIGVVLMVFQAFTGINTVIFYSTTIFELAGVDDTVRRCFIVRHPLFEPPAAALRPFVQGAIRSRPTWGPSLILWTT